MVCESKSGRAPEYAVMIYGTEGEGAALPAASAPATGQVLHELLAGSELRNAIGPFYLGFGRVAGFEVLTVRDGASNG